MANKFATCLQLGLLGLLGLRSLTPICAQEISASPPEQSATLAAERGDVATNGEKPEAWALHAQTTVVYQYHPGFGSPYQGPNSLTPSPQGKETFDLTLYAGLRLWRGAEFWINPEIDQGFGLSDTLGVAGFPSGEAYKVGSSQPYGRVQRAFLRQTINLGGSTVKVDSDLNQLAGTETANRLVFTVGKFAVVDIFDTNTYAHDPRNDFLNWAIIESAAFDYASNSWGYTYGVAAEWYQGPNAFRLGLFDLSTVPNSSELDPQFLPQFQVVAEWERQYQIAGQPGVSRLLGFATRGNMGEYDQATALAQATGQPADIAAVRSLHTKVGAALTLQQQLLTDLGLFARVSADQGQYEAYDFTDVNRSLALGFSMSGDRWARPDDHFGAGAVVNRASSAAQGFFNAGGLGILVGDGQLPHPGSERIVETYYSFSLARGVRLSFDYQFIVNPAYNRDRGPVSVFAVRFHAQI